MLYQNYFNYFLRLFLNILLWCLPLRTDAQAPLDTIRLLDNLRELSSDRYEGRAVMQKGNALARTFICTQLDSLGVAPLDSLYVQSFRFWNRIQFKKVEGKNILAMVQGTDFPDKYIVLSAHYDHIGIHKGEIYNGADDNASGTCALLELAAYFVQHPPRHSLVFAFFDAEEVGLQGAKCFVDEPPVPFKNILLNVNMDMISRSDTQTLYVCGTKHYPFLRTPLDSLSQKYDLHLRFGHDGAQSDEDDWTNASDHGAFHAAKIPFLYVGVEDHTDYHQPSDDFANIHPDFYTEAVSVVLEIIQILDEHWEGLSK